MGRELYSLLNETVDRLIKDYDTQEPGSVEPSLELLSAVTGVSLFTINRQEYAGIRDKLATSSCLSS